ncbi:aspartate dehydrogenase [Lichenihabitans sp. PAMC28606]|uniref:aspartate dehydrogenase n=1 Tax=Lichenihabitans sp. PAMC28606 TaxID=2880932 RepID=UPI001D0A4EF6|nr:aspartate dehydrogenase [Lichenihabitans sp. PAMC28606]UDL96218.1 aspartate dehydrogenase [Lichenihabitans sp. PAMC28606]
MTSQTKPLSIGIIGFGAIGRDLLSRLRRESDEMTVLLRPDSASRRIVPTSVRVVETLGDLLAVRPSIVVEAAGQGALETYGPDLLSAGITVVAASTGALADPKLFARLETAASAGGSRLVIPSGALGGLDYLAALRGTVDARVRYTSRKPPAAWRQELAARGYDADALTGEITLFEGTAAEAATLYPRNLNAGLTVALAAAPSPVSVRVVADPSVSLNTHEIEADSELGCALMRFANRPSPDNPKTSALTAASLAAAVRRLAERVVV